MRRRRIPPLLIAVGVALGACSDGSAERADDALTTPPLPAPTEPAPTEPAPTEPPTTDPPVTEPAVTEPAVTEPASEVAWPTETWETVAPAEVGLDAAALDQLATSAAAGGSDCLVVTRDGQLVGEWYWNGTGPEDDQEAFSVTKSITATLVGIAIDQGLLSLDQPASDFIEEWVGTPSEVVTIRNLLANDSGRFQDFDTDYIQMAARAEDKTAFSIALEQQFEPGTEWVYNNAAIQTLEAVLEEATGLPVGEFAAQVLFDPIGMDTTISTDAAGNTLVFMGAQADCRDLARFGLLHLRDGEWDGRQVVSSDWVDLATTPSTSLTDDYGFLWWLNANESLVPGAPEDMYAAIGMFNQFVVVFPSSGIVVTRMGDGAGPDGTSFGLDVLATGVSAALVD